MVLGLRSGVSFCEVGDQLIFLDLAADRYFALGADLNEAFRTLYAAPVSSRPPPDLAALLKSGLIVDNAIAGPAPYTGHSIPQASLLDQPLTSVPLRTLVLALAQLVRARLIIKLWGLRAGVQSVTARYGGLAGGSSDQDCLTSIAGAFRATGHFLRSHDTCLSRSVALARVLRNRRIAAQLVIGVQLRPFAAHSWVQVEGWLVNDRYENVSSYIPILVV